MVSIGPPSSMFSSRLCAVFVIRRSLVVARNAASLSGGLGRLLRVTFFLYYNTGFD